MANRPKGEAKTGPPTRARAGLALSLKLAFLVVVPVLVSLLLAGLAAAARDSARETATETRRLDAAAAAIAPLAAQAASANDTSRAMRALAIATGFPGLAHGRIERADGTVLAEAGEARLPRLSPGVVEGAAPVMLDGRRVGEVVLLGRVDGLVPRFVALAQTALPALLVALLIGAVLAWKLQAALSRPLKVLARALEGDAGGLGPEIRGDGHLAPLIDGVARLTGELRARDRQFADQGVRMETLAARAAELEAACARAEATGRTEAGRLAALARELRPALAGVGDQAERLALADLPGPARRRAQAVAQTGAMLLTIVDDALAPGRPEPPPEAGPVVLAEIAEDAAALFWPAAAAKGLDLATYVDPGSPKVIEGDPARLGRVLCALVAHALAVTTTGGVLIEIEPDTASSLRFSVRDTSAGMPKEKVAELFSETGGEPGLAACRRLVQAMGGQLQLASEPGRGSTFAFRLPSTVLEPAEVWPAARAAGAKVRLLHDGCSTRRALSRYLARAGYSLSAEADETVDLVLAAPGRLGDGAATAPTICVADGGDPTSARRLAEGAAQALMTQPFRRSELAALLQRREAGRPLTDPAPAETAQLSFDGAHVLVVDASAPGRAAIADALSRLSAKASLEHDPARVVEAALRDRFDLVLIDAGLDACTAAREIRRLEIERGYPRTPVVALAAVGAPAGAWRDAGIDGVLHRPMSLAALVETLSRYIEPLPALALPEPPAAAPEVRAEPAPAALAATPLSPKITTVHAQIPPDAKALLDDLDEAIATDQLSLVYQSQVDRDGQQITGVETLVRWVHPTRGFVNPADFIPIAEVWGSIGKVTDWVMAHAVQETADLEGLQVGFNASALEFTDAGIVDRIRAVIDKSGFDPHRLEVEITETAILENEDQVRENMAALREMGMKVALDDFGAGYSSLGHLRRYNFDKLKIDREFVIDCTQDVQSATVVHAVVSIGRALGMKVVAEGVETEQQRQFLRIAGVHAMQGFLFGRPMPIAALRETVANARALQRVRA